MFKRIKHILGIEGVKIQLLASEEYQIADGRIVGQLQFSSQTDKHAMEPQYKINPGDVMSVFVWNEPTLSLEQAVVQPDGFLSVPLAGSIKVGGLTNPAAEKQIAEALGNFLKDPPTVTLSPLQLNGNKIYVIGKVNRPGEYPVNSQIDVMQALALAGGLNSFAAENSINILRRNADGKQVAIEFEYGEVKDGDELQTNILLNSGDVVVVP